MNVEMGFLVLREFQEGGTFSFQVEKPLAGDRQEIYLTMRGTGMTLQGALVFKVATPGPASVRLAITETALETLS